MNKKIIALVLMLGMVSSLVMAGSSWMGLSGTYELATYGEEYNQDEMTVEKAANFAGFGLNAGFFGDSGFGVNAQVSYLFHLEDTESVKWDSAYSVYVGPGYRFEIADTFGLYGSVGFSWRNNSKTFGSDTIAETTYSMSQVGIGAQVGAQVKLAPTLMFFGGVQAGYHFNVTSTVDIKNVGKTSSKIDDYNSFTVAPFVGIGYAF